MAEMEFKYYGRLADWAEDSGWIYDYYADGWYDDMYDRSVDVVDRAWDAYLCWVKKKGGDVRKAYEITIDCEMPI